MKKFDQELATRRVIIEMGALAEPMVAAAQRASSPGASAIERVHERTEARSVPGRDRSRSIRLVTVYSPAAATSVS
jgi:hypothetical protein